MTVIVRNRSGRYLERVPFDGSWRWLAASAAHATPLTKRDVGRLARTIRIDGARMAEAWPTMIADPLQRAPEAV
jgi:hypothetical protein